MRPLNYIERFLPMMIVIILLATVAACDRRQKLMRQPEEISEISDSVRHGNMQAAVCLTTQLKEKALAQGDSLLWSDALIQQGVNAYYMGNPTLLKSSADSAISWLSRQKVTPNVARILAKGYQTSGAYFDQYYYTPDSLVRYLRKTVDYSILADDAGHLPQALGNYANALRMSATLDSAALYYHRAIAVADSLGLDTIHYIPLYNGIAGVFTDMRDFTNSQIWWGKSMDILGSMSSFDKFNTLTGYGNDLYYREDYAGANRVFRRLKGILDSIPGAEWERMFTTVNLADTYIRLGEVKNEMLDTAYTYFSVTQPNPVATSYIHSLQIRSALNEHQPAKALAIAKAHPLSDTLRLEQLLARLQALEELYASTGNYEKAYEMNLRYEHLTDSLRSANLRKQISALNVMYQRDKRILNLQAGNTRQQAHIYRLLALVALSLVVIVGLVLLVFLRRQRAQRRERKMMDKIISLRQENLRNRVTPHFIYNALNHELNNSDSGSPSHLDALVHLIRRQQFVASEILIPFADELAFVDDYIRIVGDSGRAPLRYTCDVASDISTDFLFPSMALQILVENAFKHGFSTLPRDEERVLDITVRRAADSRIAVIVFNNSGPGAGNQHGDGTGLRVLVETIRMLNERNRGKTEFHLEANSHGEGGDERLKGCTAEIILPSDLTAV